MICIKSHIIKNSKLAVLINLGKKCFLWTDVICSVVVFLGILTVFVFGIIDVPGGFVMLIQKVNEKWSQDEVNYSISPHSYASMMVGQFLIWLFIYSVYYGSG